MKTARIGCEGPRSVATPQQCQREIGRHRANVRRVRGGHGGGNVSYIRDDAAAVALLVGVYVQAAHDALAGDDAAAAWLHINEIPPSTWPMVAKVTATPPKPYKPHRAAA